MAYIDTSKVTIPKGFFEDLNVPKLLEWLNNQPTADVVPRAMIAEIFEEIEKIILDNTYPDFDKNGKACNIWKPKSGYDAIAELKKKYTEENK